LRRFRRTSSQLVLHGPTPTDPSDRPLKGADPGRYRDELAAHAERLDALRRRARSAPLTIIYAARDREHNNAVVLAELLRDG
jgi:hypothetical protein